MKEQVEAVKVQEEKWDVAQKQKKQSKTSKNKQTKRDKQTKQTPTTGMLLNKLKSRHWNGDWEPSPGLIYRRGISRIQKKIKNESHRKQKQIKQPTKFSRTKDAGGRRTTKHKTKPKEKQKENIRLNKAMQCRDGHPKQHKRNWGRHSSLWKISFHERR